MGNFFILYKDVVARKDLSSTDKLIFTIVKDRIGQNDNSWVGIQRIAKDAGCHRTSVIRSISRLEKFELLVVERRGNGQSNLYSLPKTSSERQPVAKSDRLLNATTARSKKRLEPVAKNDCNYTDPLNQTQSIDQNDKNQKKCHGSDDQRFDEFWAAYPKKKAKGDAQKAWGKLKPDEALFDQIMTALKVQRQSVDWKKDNGQYIPHPTKWLNGQRWEDEIDLGDNDSGPVETMGLDAMPPEQQQEILNAAGY